MSPMLTGRSVAAGLLAGSLLLGPAGTAAADRYHAVDEGPTALEMTADLMVTRPLHLTATGLGAAVFLVSLPFSALGGNVDEAAEQLVAGPARATFKRCLGCTEADQARQEGTAPPQGMSPR